MAKDTRINLRCPRDLYADLSREMERRIVEKGEKKISLSSLIISLLSSSLAEIFRKREYANTLREKRRKKRLNLEDEAKTNRNSNNGTQANGETHDDQEGA